MEATQQHVVRRRLSRPAAVRGQVSRPLRKVLEAQARHLCASVAPPERTIVHARQDVASGSPVVSRRAAQGFLVSTRILGKSMRDAVKNKKRWKRRVRLPKILVLT